MPHSQHHTALAPVTCSTLKVTSPSPMHATPSNPCQRKYGKHKHGRRDPSGYVFARSQSRGVPLCSCNTCQLCNSLLAPTPHPSASEPLPFLFHHTPLPCFCHLALPNHPLPSLPPSHNSYPPPPTPSEPGPPTLIQHKITGQWATSASNAARVAFISAASIPLVASCTAAALV